MNTVNHRTFRTPDDEYETALEASAIAECMVRAGIALVVVVVLVVAILWGTL